MKLNSPPTFQELEEVRQKMIKDIEEAGRLFSESKELQTSRTGLKHIEEMIDGLRTDNGESVDDTEIG